jgi:8-oxo-dGTP pyrophosphatase MutT (NUDIX family)
VGRQVAVPFVAAANRDPSYLVQNPSGVWRDGKGRVAGDIYSSFAEINHIAVVDSATNNILWDQMVVNERPGAYILAINYRGEIGLVWKYRPISQTEGWELPRGFSMDGEKPKATAMRELREELGDYEIKRIVVLKRTALAKSAYCTHGQFVALIRVGKKLSDPFESEKETITCGRFFPLKDVHRLSVEGRIIGSDDRGIMAWYEDLLELGRLPC